ncbi:unnamed protein product [Ectocarpus fasciculatus]
MGSRQPGNSPFGSNRYAVVFLCVVHFQASNDGSTRYELVRERMAVSTVVSRETLMCRTLQLTRSSEGGDQSYWRILCTDGCSFAVRSERGGEHWNYRFVFSLPSEITTGDPSSHEGWSSCVASLTERTRDIVTEIVWEKMSGGFLSWNRLVFFLLTYSVNRGQARRAEIVVIDVHQLWPPHAGLLMW